MRLIPTPRNLAFLFGIWLLGRAIVLAAFVWAAPHGWHEAFLHWDGAWYRQIATIGYTYANDAQHHSTAFFPLFPLLASLGMRAGFPFTTAAVLTNNLAMLAALFAIFALVCVRADETLARWTCAILALVPLSLFTVVAYSEGTYLCASAFALLASERGKYAGTALWGALASAARPAGVALAIASILAGMRKGDVRAIVAGVLSLLGVAAFALYLYRAFGDPLAFITVQRAWRGTAGVDWKAWWAVLTMGFDGYRTLGHAVALAAFVIAVRRNRFDSIGFVCGAVFAALESYIWSYNALTVLFLAGGVTALLVHRAQIGSLQVLYALCAVALILASGTPFSADRNAYAIVPLDIALALVARGWPALGYPALALMAWGLAVDAAAFARFQWVA